MTLSSTEQHVEIYGQAKWLFKHVLLVFFNLQFNDHLSPSVTWVDLQMKRLNLNAQAFLQWEVYHQPKF